MAAQPQLEGGGGVGHPWIGSVANHGKWDLRKKQQAGHELRGGEELGEGIGRVFRPQAGWWRLCVSMGAARCLALQS